MSECMVAKPWPYAPGRSQTESGVVHGMFSVTNVSVCIEVVPNLGQVAVIV